MSEWKVGSPFGWKGTDDKMVTHGSIVQIVPEQLLPHQLLDSVGTIDSVITYEFAETNQATTLHAREEFAKPITDQEYEDAVEGWDAALRAVKETAES